MLSNEVKNFNCYGSGWLFDKDSEARVDLKKMDFGKGYTVNIQHFGTVDPIFGDQQSENSWLYDNDFIYYLFSKFKLEKKFYDYISDVEPGLIEAADDNGVELIDEIIDVGAVEFISEFLESIGLCEGEALCGITDEDYFKDCLVKLGYDDDSLVDIIFLG